MYVWGCTYIHTDRQRPHICSFPPPLLFCSSNCCIMYIWWYVWMYVSVTRSTSDKTEQNRTDPSQQQRPRHRRRRRCQRPAGQPVSQLTSWPPPDFDGLGKPVIVCIHTCCRSISQSINQSIHPSIRSRHRQCAWACACLLCSWAFSC